MNLNDFTPGGCTQANADNRNATAANQMLKFMNVSPSTAIRTKPPPNWQQYKDNTHKTEFPVPRNNVTYATEIKLLRLTKRWLTQTIAKMHIYCRFWNGSCSLADIAPNSLGIGTLTADVRLSGYFTNNPTDLISELH